MKTFGVIVEMMADKALGKESIDKLGGMEGVRDRVRAYLEGEYGRRGWTLTWVSIVAWGRKSAA